jgi:hypothetical protein
MLMKNPESSGPENERQRRIREINYRLKELALETEDAIKPGEPINLSEEYHLKAVETAKLQEELKKLEG